MKRAKDDEKITGPMFPRLHVNDTAKGGPKPPPRNKMALYEQFSIPSQRFNPGVFPSQPSNYGNLVHPPCSSQGSGHGRNMIFPVHLHPSTPTHASSKFQSQRADEADSSPLLTQSGKRKKSGDEDDFMVPVFVHAGSKSQTQNGVESKTSASSFASHTLEIYNSSEKRSKGVSSSAFSSRQEVTNGSKESLKEGPTNQQHPKKSATNFAIRDHIYKPSEEPNASLNQQEHDNSGDNVSGLNTPDASLQRSHRPGPRLEDTTCGRNVGEHIERVDNLTSPLPRSNSQSGEVDDDHENHAEQTCRSLQPANAERSDDGSETSMVDSISGSDITPDDVVEILGQKHFWKARRAIVNQQRVFAIQVFELHRLIKVQRLIAGSPHILLEDAAFLGKASVKTSPEKKLSSDVTKTSTHVVKSKDDSEKPNHKLECSAENAVGRTSQSSAKNGTQLSNYGPYVGNPPQTPVATDTSTVPWGFHQPTGHQWLIPVMSHSEGLVYKPYPGPGFAGTGCGGCGPVGSTFFPGSFMNPPYVIPTPHHYQGMGVLPGAPPVSHGYFPPYGMPGIAPAMSGASVEQVNWLNSAGSQGQNGQISGGGASTNMQQNSSSLPSQQAGAVPASVRLQVSKESEPQGSIASSPSEREQGRCPGSASAADGIDALPLFPIGPVDAEGIPQPQDTDQAIRVIRVVPHNPRTATESAARIFKSIQEERKQYDPL